MITKTAAPKTKQHDDPFLLEQDAPVQAALSLGEMRRTLARLEQEADANAASMAAASTAIPPAAASKASKPMNANAPSLTSNATTLDDVIDTARLCGADHGRGSEAQITLSLKVFQAAFEGTLDTAPDKHGDGIDDATRIAEAYVAGRQGAVKFDVRANKTAKLISTVRTPIRLGNYGQLGDPAEPMGMVDRFITAYRQVRKDPARAGSLIDANNAFLTLARAQLKRDTVIPDDEFEGFITKKEPEPITVVEFLRGEHKKFAKLVNGSLTRHKLMDDDPLVKAILRDLTKRIRAIDEAPTA